MIHYNLAFPDTSITSIFLSAFLGVQQDLYRNDEDVDAMQMMLMKICILRVGTVKSSSPKQS